MTAPDRQQQAERLRQRLLELERRFEATRQRAEIAEAALGRITDRWWWRWLRSMRKRLLGGGAATSAPSGRLPPVARSRMRERVLDFVSTLPAETLLPQALPADRAGWFAGPALDFASIMPWLYANADGARAADGTGPIIAWVGSAGLRRELERHARVVWLDGDGGGEESGDPDFDLLLIEPTRQCVGEPWRTGLIEEGRAREQVRARIGAARAASRPVLCWVTSAAEVEQSRWLWADVDFLFLPAPHPAAPLATILAECVSAAIYNPLKAPSLLKAATKGRTQVLVDGVARGMGDPAWLRASGHLADRLLAIESSDAVDAAALRQQPRLASSFLGELDAFGRAVLLRLAGAELYPVGPVGTDRRHVLQAAASGAIPLFPPGLSATLPEGIVDGDVSLLDDPLARARVAHANWRAVQANHTVGQRLQAMFQVAGLPRAEPPQPRVACLLVSRRPHLLPSCIERFRNDLYPNKELVIAVHRDTADLVSLQRLVQAGEQVKILRLGESMSLGACLNTAFAQTSAPYWAKWDDDDFYGPAYLSDLMSYRQQADFDIAGKPRAFTWSEADSTLYWEDRWAARAHAWVSSVDARNPSIAGATLLGHRRVLEDVPFPEGLVQGTDSEFLRRALARGWSVLSADPFNFVRFRAGDPSQHTWRDTGADDLASARPLGGAQAVQSHAFI